MVKPSPKLGHFLLVGALLLILLPLIVLRAGTPPAIATHEDAPEEQEDAPEEQTDDCDPRNPYLVGQHVHEDGTIVRVYCDNTTEVIEPTSPPPQKSTTTTATTQPPPPTRDPVDEILDVAEDFTDPKSRSPVVNFMDPKTRRQTIKAHASSTPESRNKGMSTVQHYIGSWVDTLHDRGVLWDPHNTEAVTAAAVAAVWIAMGEWKGPDGKPLFPTFSNGATRVILTQLGLRALSGDTRVVKTLENLIGKLAAQDLKKKQ